MTMKRLLVLVLGFGIVLGSPMPAVPIAGTVAVHAAQDPAKITVYITKTGEKYHRDGCRYLSRSKIASTLKEALARGLGACSVCKPATTR
jgi:hypothetical protein